MRRLACCECRLKRQHGADGLKGGWVVGGAVALLQATALGHGGMHTAAALFWAEWEVKAS